MHLRSGRTLGPEVVPEDSASNVDLEAILGSSLIAKERSSLNSTSSVLGQLFEYKSSTYETMSMEDNTANPREIQVSIAQTTGTQSPTQSISSRIYEGISNFFGRFDPRAQLFDNVDDINAMARANVVTSGFPDVTEHTARVMTPSSAQDLQAQNVHAEGGPASRFDSEAGPSNRQWSHRSFTNAPQMEAHAERMPQPPGPVPYFQDRPPMARPPITTMAYQGPTPRFSPVSIGPTYTQTRPTVSPPHDIPSTSYYVDPHMRQYPRPVQTQQAYVPPQQLTYPQRTQPQMPYQQPPPIHQIVLSDDALRTLVQAIGRGAPAQAAFPAARDHHGSRNRSIAIAKLITKFHGEGDPITYVERFEQICAAFGDVSDGDKIGAFGIQLDGKAGAWYRARKEVLSCCTCIIT